MAGRRPKPTALKRLEGNPGRRPLNLKEPKYEGDVRCPSYLDDEAKREWRRIAPILKSQGMLTPADQTALAMYCRSYSVFMEADRMIREHGAVVRAPKNNYPMPNPFVAIRNQAFDQMRKFMVEFGMTPASRTRLNVPGGNSKDSDPLLEFLNRKRKKTTSDAEDDGDEGYQVN